MKKGFTLIEVLAVITLITIMTLLIMPNILNSVNNKRGEISDSAKKMIYDAADIYVKENSDIYLSNNKNAVYCISLESLVQNGKLSNPVKDMKTNKELALNENVKVTIDDYNQYQYELVKEDDCNTTISIEIGYNVSKGYSNKKVLTINYPKGDYIKKYKVLNGTTEDNIIINLENESLNDEKKITFTSNGQVEVWIENKENNSILSSITIDVTNIDYTPPNKPTFKSKTINNNATILYDGIYDNESGIKHIECKYGNSNQNLIYKTKDTSGKQCNFPLTAEYGQICITNNVNLTTCSTPKQLAVYLIKDGQTLVEFSNTNSSGVEVSTMKFNAKTKSLDVTIASGGGRKGIYTKNSIDLANYSYVYSDLSSTINVNYSSETNPSFGVYFYQSSDVYQQNSTNMGGNTIYSGNLITTLDNSYPRKTYIIDVSDLKTQTYGTIGYYEFRRNISYSNITAKIYNVYMQLEN